MLAYFYMVMDENAVYRSLKGLKSRTTPSVNMSYSKKQQESFLKASYASTTFNLYTVSSPTIKDEVFVL